MITAITGTPGSGKTAYALNLLIEELKKSSRPLYVHGVPHLRIPHETVKCSSLNCDTCFSLPATVLRADEWHVWAPEGSLIFYDEVQNVYRPRSSSSRVPDSVAGLETHRHKGIDFIIVTQHPSLIDANVKRLVSKHIHLSATWARRIQYEWGECVSNPQSTSTAVKSTYKIPKRVYPLYQSATIHTKLTRKIPVYLYFVVFVLLFVIYGVYRFYTSKVASSELSSSSQSLGSQGSDLSSRFDFVATVPNRPESAPAYADLLKVRDFPRLTACIRSEKKCTCYTQQATEYFVSRQECIDYVQSGRFDPYKEPTKITSNYQPMPATNHSPPSYQAKASDSLPFTSYVEQND